MWRDAVISGGGCSVARMEGLEGRALMSASGGGVVGPVAPGVEPIDGVGNNVRNATWGATGTDLLRESKAAYGDGISSPAGSNRPSARVISNAIDAQSGDIENDRGLSDLVYVFGQFLDHDIDLTNEGTTEAFDVAVPKGDPSFDPAGTGTQVIPDSRSDYDPATGTSKANPRQQENAITAFIDGSQIYGSDAATAASLRTFHGGLLKTSAGDLLPVDPTTGMFLTGDVRADENVELTAMQTLWMREHNRIAGQLAAAHPAWTDEQLYQGARRVVIAELQSITYNEFLPALLGPGAIRPYQGYNPKVNPGIATEFSTAAYRFGHSMLDGDVDKANNEGTDAGTVALRDAFFNPSLLAGGADVGLFLKGASLGTAQEIDVHVVDDLRNFLFGQPGQGGMDLASLNIQRGRDHGIADYNTVRAAYGLPRVRTFADVTSDKAMQASLKATYGTVDNVDLWVGGLAEDHAKGGSLGPLFTRIVADQFTRLRDGDRYFFENTFKGAELDQVEHTTLADVIRRNTQMSSVTGDVFFSPAAATKPTPTAGGHGSGTHPRTAPPTNRPPGGMVTFGKGKGVWEGLFAKTRLW